MTKRSNGSGSRDISEVERERREEAVEFARASLGLEGFKISDAAEERVRRFVSGEIDLAEFLKISKE